MIARFITGKFNVDVEQFIERQDLRKQFLLLFKTLTPQEVEVLCLRFGFNDGYTHTLQEIGNRMKRSTERKNHWKYQQQHWQEYFVNDSMTGVTPERVRQIISTACRKLRHPTRSRQIEDFLYVRTN